MADLIGLAATAERILAAWAALTPTARACTPADLGNALLDAEARWLNSPEGVAV